MGWALGELMRFVLGQGRATGVKETSVKRLSWEKRSGWGGQDVGEVIYEGGATMGGVWTFVTELIGGGRRKSTPFCGEDDKDGSRERRSDKGVGR